ncbi:ABC transporter ATP-binding protein [Pseudofulvibacter geojedonensis]|uniref:ABC transporter ATP-binding protein n=1 Tax=Pseudofulvibacter geojedonensis TaxID=1123758 RepID=A0ABW3HZF5_9FLAO
MDYIKKLWRFIIPYKKYAYLNIFFNILYALFGTLGFVALIPMLDVLFENKEVITAEPVFNGIANIKDYVFDYLNFYMNSTYGDDKQSALNFMAIIIIGIFLLKSITGYFSGYFLVPLRSGVLKDIRDELYDKTIHLPISYFSEKRKGDTISRIVADVGEIQNSLLAMLELIVREPFTILFALGSMLAISGKLTLFVFIFIPISGFIISRIGKVLKKRSDKVMKEQGIFLSILDETLSGLTVLKGFNAQQFFNNRFKNSTTRFKNHLTNLLRRQILASPTSEFLGIVTIAVLLVYGGHLVLVEKVIDGSDFIGYIGLAYGILTPAKKISKASYKVKAGNASADRVLEVLNMQSSLEDKENAIEKVSFDNIISFKNISFKYEDNYVLKNFSLDIPKGKTIALVGQSGSGKSTIANLITRFYDVNEGTIEIDGISIKDLTKESLRDLMGLVTQKSILFNDTIKNNIKLSHTKASDQDVFDAARVANAYDFIQEQPEGFNTNIGDGGGKLSGGQQQRIAIARAVLKNSPIMILDEATSALDTESEKMVQVALENMMKNRTSIVIAHRLSTIQNADLIVVMQKGEIVEQGNHQELIAKNGTYKKLVDMQSL